MDRVVRMMKTGDFNPHFFDWPSLTFYLNLVVSCLVFMGGAMRGLWGHLDQVSANDLYLGGRIFTALVGTATVALTIAAARRWSTTAALVAGALMAVVPGHVRESHYVLTDVPTAFFTSLFLHCRRTRWGACCGRRPRGLAASCKYNGAIALIMPLIVVW
jgi:dolichyl-phosphate-mannose--protein O-mannosyl transferase